MCLPQQLRNRVVVVTQASNATAHAAARRFADRGANVVLADSNAAALLETAKAVRRHGARVTHVVADADSADGRKAIQAHAELMFGGIDLWILPTPARAKPSHKAALVLILSLGAALFGLSRWGKAS
jgi:NAD(P)-dependent dehydrogenase (short-subunit alcohol dehydrogenase family)